VLRENNAVSKLRHSLLLNEVNDVQLFLHARHSIFVYLPSVFAAVTVVRLAFSAENGELGAIDMTVVGVISFVCAKAIVHLIERRLCFVGLGFFHSSHRIEVLENLSVKTEVFVATNTAAKDKLGDADNSSQAGQQVSESGEDELRALHVGAHRQAYVY